MTCYLSYSVLLTFFHLRLFGENRSLEGMGVKPRKVDNPDEGQKDEAS